MILLIDNYDSFTYNLYQFFGEIYPDIKVVRNDEITIEEIEKLSPEAIIVSPGPGYPKDAGISIEAIKHFSGKMPILGICLGHQSICEAFGGKIVPAKELMHGKSSSIKIDTSSDIFKTLPETIVCARYHSLIADEGSLPDCLKVIGYDSSGQIMAVEHKQYPTYGLQFHPESVLTNYGKIIIKNFLSKIEGINMNNINTPAPEMPKTQLKPFIAKVVDGNSLSQEEAMDAMDIIMSGNATDAQISSLLTALRIKGETIDEITGFAKIMREKANTVKDCKDAIDIVGTGGDLSNTFNISTTASFVIAGCGVKVAKHGNRSVSSKSGAADVLENLGVKITSSPEQAKEMIDKIGISFLFAQSYHGSMRFVGPARRETGIRTVFNILGPLSNPANTDYILLGVYDKELLKPMAEVLMNLGIKRAMLVYGNDRLDEISISDNTSVCEIKDGEMSFYEINPEDYGFKKADKKDVVGGTAEENAKITLGILQGKIKDAKRDIVLLNAGCALYICGKADTIKGGIELAAASIDGGWAEAKLNQLIEKSNSF
ncbi:bifunctional anthranilate synthase component II/anthranilate phosphoribosyltransferase [Porcipelethomonas sp.]|uniref:bifunctional anthranilate synthase component II/anthranilate phosphoribosyltransferase n=1 Tax=Porcipelethomonas sp. TaxID=2981675 RepID=UPI003EF35FEF